jgi:hypothetical protein
MTWHIYEDGSGRWHWELIDQQHNVVLQSRASFAARDECVRDARASGYSDEHGGPLDHGHDELDEH